MNTQKYTCDCDLDFETEPLEIEAATAARAAQEYASRTDPEPTDGARFPVYVKDANGDVEEYSVRCHIEIDYSAVRKVSK